MLRASDNYKIIIVNRIIKNSPPRTITSGSNPKIAIFIGFHSGKVGKGKVIYPGKLTGPAYPRDSRLHCNMCHVDIYEWENVNIFSCRVSCYQYNIYTYLSFIGLIWVSFDFHHFVKCCYDVLFLTVLLDLCHALNKYLCGSDSIRMCHMSVLLWA